MRVARLVHTGPVTVTWVTEPLPDAIRRQDARIERIWEQAVAERPGTLFDGTVLTCLHMADNAGTIEVTAQFVPYRYYFAQQSAPDLNLGLTAVAVSGVTVLTEPTGRYVVFGRRGPGVTDYPRRMELVPSGGIAAQRAEIGGRVDYPGQVMQELEEEACVPADWVERIDGFALLFDETDRTYDVACWVRLRAAVDRRAFTECFSRSAEYAPDPVFVPVSELKEFVRAHAEDMVPTSRVLVEAFAGGPTLEALQ